MKPTSFSTLLFFSMIIFVSLTSSAKKEEMQLHLSIGQHYTYLITRENEVLGNSQVPGMSQKMVLKIDHQVIDQLANGNYLIESSFKSFSIILKNNGAVNRYTSDTVDVSNSMYKTLNFLTDIKLEYEISPKGVVKNISGFEPIMKKKETDNNFAPLFVDFGNEQFIVDLYNYFPVENVGVGDKWMRSGILTKLNNLKYDIKYTLKEASDKNLKLNMDVSFRSLTEVPQADGKVNKVNKTGTTKGELLVDQKTGMLLSSDSNQHIEISLANGTNPKEEKLPSLKVIDRTSIVLVKK